MPKKFAWEKAEHTKTKPFRYYNQLFTHRKEISTMFDKKRVREGLILAVSDVHRNE